MSVFKGVRPSIGDTFKKKGQQWEVAAIAANIGVVVLKLKDITSATDVTQFIVIQEEIG